MHALNQTGRKSGEGPTVLILLPTRELAQQVDEVARIYCKPMGLETVCCFGGASKNTQAQILMNGMHSFN